VAGGEQQYIVGVNPRVVGPRVDVVELPVLGEQRSELGERARRPDQRLEQWKLRERIVLETREQLREWDDEARRAPDARRVQERDLGAWDRQRHQPMLDQTLGDRL